MSAAGLTHRLKAQALGLGFDLVGVARLGVPDTLPYFTQWLADGRHAGMDYLARGAALRADARRPQPGMVSAVVVALDYGGREPAGPVARYARGDDYHRVMWDRLDALLAWLQEQEGPVAGRAFVDSGPVLERDLARRAGLGWFGKNTVLINPQRGSFFFLGALFVAMALEPDAPFDADRCGTCTRCLDACPTGALPAPHVLDAARCISYLTIEHRGAFTPDQTEMVGAHLFGCDICQDVCPWNVRFARALPAGSPFAPRAVLDGKDARTLATDLLAMDETAYRAAFRGSALTRAKLAGLQRNARAVVGNLDTGEES